MESPRKRHYVLGHEAFRQMCEHDPHQFFELMASTAQKTFISELVKQVEQSFPEDDTKLDVESMTVTVSKIDNWPCLIVKMPPAKAYVECELVGIVCLLEGESDPEISKPKIAYFTLEIGEGGNIKEGVGGEFVECRLFCQWREDIHYNLAEMEKNVSIDDFSLMIKQSLS